MQVLQTATLTLDIRCDSGRPNQSRSPPHQAPQGSVKCVGFAVKSVGLAVK